MSNPPDARRLLGVGDDADADDVRAARRRLAKAIHPDVQGGNADAMRALNEAADFVLDQIASASTTADVRPQPATPPPSRRRPVSGARLDHDVASFVIESLPVEAFEALLIVTSWIGEVVVDEPPYQLDVLLVPTRSRAGRRGEHRQRDDRGAAGRTASRDRRRTRPVGGLAEPPGFRRVMAQRIGAGRWALSAVRASVVLSKSMGRAAATGAMSAAAIWVS